MPHRSHGQANKSSINFADDGGPDEMPIQRPKTAGDRAEDEMKAKALKEMENATDPIEKLRFFCLSRGNGGIASLGRWFRSLDDDGNKNLNYEEFSIGLKGLGVDIADDEMRPMFQAFDTDNSGSVGVTEFITKVRPRMNDKRRKVILEAFAKMDATGDGIITVEDMMGKYKVDRHPQYLSGELTKEDILEKFLGNFEGPSGNKDGRVNEEEFIDYYSTISASIDDDAYFDLMMRNAWKM